MESPMRDILARRTKAARAECEEIRDIIEKEELACAERIEKQVRPILVKEFKRVAKRYALRGVRFGNGTCLIMSDEGVFLIDAWDNVLPKGLDKLQALCDAICSTYPTDDITTEDLE
jgi:hypothetical protein